MDKNRLTSRQQRNQQFRHDEEYVSRMVFSAYLFNESGPCQSCPVILDGILKEKTYTLEKLCQDSPDHEMLNAHVHYFDAQSPPQNNSSPEKGVIITLAGMNYLLRSIFDRAKVQKVYNEIKAGGHFFSRGKNALNFTCLLNRPEDFASDEKLVNQLKYYWRELSSIMKALASEDYQSNLFDCLLRIHKIKIALSDLKLTGHCERLQSWLNETDYLVIPPQSEEPEDMQDSYRAFFSIRVFSLCNWLRLQLLNQKSNLDMVVYQKKGTSDKAQKIFGGSWWEQQLNLSKKFRLHKMLMCEIW